MKKRILTMLCMCLCLFSSTMTVWANNHEDTQFTVFQATTSQTYHALPAREKMDYSPMYLYYTKGAYSQVLVKAFACYTSGSHAPNRNLNVTEKGLTGTITDFVTCGINIKYSIHTQVKEKEYDWGTLGFKSYSASDPDYITGVWSCDSLYTYTHAQ